MRVGFVLAGVFTGSSIALCPSVASLFPDDGKDTLIIFPGGKLNSPNSLEQMKNSIYDLVNEDNIDGTIVWSSSLSGSVNSTVVLKRFEEILSKPLVTIDGKSDSFPKIPNVCFDAYEGSRFLIQHCITVHWARRILYLRGPLNHNSSIKRYQAYLDALKENGIPIDYNLISEPTEWSQGGEGLRNMLETRNLRPGRDFDMIVCASDLMTYESEQVLKSYGYVVGEDVFICGFNDSIDSRLLKVPATTVRLPYSGIGKTALSTLYSLAEGKRCYDKVLATTPIIRRSCGCEAFEFSSAISSASDLAAQLVKDFGFSSAEARGIVNCVAKEPSEANVRAMLEKLFEEGADNHEVIKVINGFKDILSKEKYLLLSKNAYSIVPSFLDNRMSRLSFDERNSRRVFNSFINQLLETSNFQEIVTVLNNNAKALGFSKIHLVYNDGGKSFLIQQESNPIEFPEKMLVPSSMGTLLDPGAWIATPLCSETEFMGYLLLKASRFDGFMCEEVRSAVSSAIKNARLFETARKAQQSAEQADFSRTHFFANVTENLRSPLTEISELVLNSQLDDSSRNEINNRIVDVKRTIDLSLISTGELELNCSCTNVSEFLKGFACYKDEGPLACVMLDERLFRKIVEIIVSGVGLNPQITAYMSRNGVKIRIFDKDGIWEYSENPSLDYAKQIVLLHNGNYSIERHGISITLPYPTLDGSVPSAIGENAIVVCINGMPGFATNTTGFDGVKFLELDGATLAVKRRLPSGASAVYWDGSFKGYNALTGLLSLISNDVYRKLPFICLECSNQRTFEDSMRSYVEAKGRVLLQVGSLSENLHRWLQSPNIIACDFSNVLSMFRRYNPRLAIFTIEQYKSNEQSQEKLVDCLHGIRNKYLSPIIICSDYINAQLIQEISTIPNVLFVNSCILESDEFAMRVRAILGGSELLAPLTGQIVKKAQLYLCQHSTLSISRWQVADEVHTSEDYLTRIFKKELGLSPWEYLNRYRIWLAENLLRNTGMSVNEVSNETGFQDQAYFCRVFKKIKGYSPVKVKKR